MTCESGPEGRRLTRCAWGEGSDIERAYHDTEWGVPQHDDRRLFEMLTLEGAQAGLSWRLVLSRREHYRRAFHEFDIARVAAMPDEALDRLVADPGLIRNRLKIVSVRDNARAALRAIAEAGSLDAYLWSFVGGRPQVNRPASQEAVPARSELSDAMSRALRKRGFRFVGSTICYAFMQATGMVDDHVIACFRSTYEGEEVAMRQAIERLTIPSQGAGLKEITGEILRWVALQGIATGLLTVFCRHTSASLLVQENADPDVRADLLAFFRRLAPEGAGYAHDAEGSDDMPAHLRTALTQTQLGIPVEAGRPMLGTWQGIYLFEHRVRPHRREIVLHLIGEP